MNTNRRRHLSFGGRKVSGVDVQPDPRLQQAVNDSEAFLERELESVTSTTVTLRMPTDVRDKLDAIARREERSLNGQALYFLRRAIAQYEQSLSIVHLDAPPPLERPRWDGPPAPQADVRYDADTTAP